MTKTKTKLLSIFTCYGLYVFLGLIEQYEEEDKYEICRMLVDVIKEYEANFNSKSKYVKLELETRKSEQTIKEFIQSFKNSENKGAIALANMPYYISELRTIVENELYTNKEDEKQF